MDTFVIIFRQGPRTLTETEVQRRNLETSAWAREQNAAGHKLDPHILGPASEVRGAVDSASAPAGAAKVTALLFLEARDLDDAAGVAASHPALSYGATVEVRPWAPPPPVPATA